MLTTKEMTTRIAGRANEKQAEQRCPEDSGQHQWAIPLGIIVLLMILGLTIASIASDIFPTY